MRAWLADNAPFIGIAVYLALIGTVLYVNSRQGIVINVRVEGVR